MNGDNRFKVELTDDLWAEQLAYYRDHLDVAIMKMFAPMKLTDQQSVIARAFGRSHTIDIVQSRGAGKTWLVAMCCSAICVLYPGTPVIVCSGTARQANLILAKISKECKMNKNLLNEIKTRNPNRPCRITKDGGICEFKNGSTIESMSIMSMRGNRAKILVIDESPEVKLKEQGGIFKPVRNYKRESCIAYGVPDFPSKIVKITSACLKSNDFYDDFLTVSREMGSGDRGYFSIALDYKYAVRTGINEATFFEQERKSLPKTQFDMEYNSVFIGAATNSLFPYELTSSCRTLRNVEIAQPKDSKSQYVMGVDIATSDAEGSDNTVITVLKISEKSDGSYHRQMVLMRS